MAKVKAYVKINAEEQNLQKCTKKDILNDVALFVTTDDYWWGTLAEALEEKESEFVAGAVKDNMASMGDLIASLSEEDGDTVQKYIELEDSKISNDGDEYAEMYVPYTFDWGKYREDKAKENAA